MRREMRLAVVVWIVLSLGGLAQGDDLERTIDAIRMVESSGGKDKADGDDGRAIGDYQIWKAYWQDGTRFLKVNWPYEDARDPAKARKVVRAYITGYQRAKGYPATPETWARIHNGGPRGPEKKSTLVYLEKFRKNFARQ